MRQKFPFFDKPGRDKLYYTCIRIQRSPCLLFSSGGRDSDTGLARKSGNKVSTHGEEKPRHNSHHNMILLIVLSLSGIPLNLLSSLRVRKPKVSFLNSCDARVYVWIMCDARSSLRVRLLACACGGQRVHKVPQRSYVHFISDILIVLSSD